MKFSSDSVINFSPEAKDPGQSDPDSDRSEYNLKLFVGLYLFLLTLQWDMQKKQPLAPGGSGATGDNLPLCCGGGQTLRDTYILPHMHSQPHPLITTYVCPCASTAAISKHATSCFYRLTDNSGSQPNHCITDLWAASQASTHVSYHDISNHRGIQEHR